MSRGLRASTGLHLGIATVVASVWLHQGLWCKILRMDPTHEMIVAAVPWVGRSRARAATFLIGSIETALAGWVLSRRAPASAAAVQTALLVAMNGGGLRFASERIPQPTRMVLRNAALIAAIWAIPALGRRQ